MDDPDELAEAAARAAVADLEAAVEAHGTATWVLTGGGTPVAAYQRLAASDLRAGVEWERIRVAMGDERCVPVTDPDSNWGQAAAALLDHVPVPGHHLLRPQAQSVTAGVMVPMVAASRRRSPMGSVKTAESTISRSVTEVSSANTS